MGCNAICCRVNIFVTVKSCDLVANTYDYSWVKLATNVSATAGLSWTSSTKLIGGAFADSSHSASGLSPQSIFDAGILKSKPGALITTYVNMWSENNVC